MLRSRLIATAFEHPALTLDDAPAIWSRQSYVRCMEDSSLVAVVEAHIKDCRRHGRSRTGPANVLGIGCRPGRRLPLQAQVASNVDGALLKMLPKVR
jgi:hypothetical protein